RPLALFALAAALACSGSHGARTCAADKDCPAPETCAGGRCVDTGFCVGSASCSDDSTCAAGSHCDNGCCAPGTSGSCRRDADCSAHPSTPVCDTGAGSCVGCLVARDCGAGKICENETCKALPGCSASADCLPPTPVCDV